MRIRATVAAVTGALALSAFAVPAAQAADPAPSFGTGAAKVLQAAHAASGKTTFTATTATDGQPYALNVSFSNLKIGKAYKVGTTYAVDVPVTYTLTHGADVDITATDFQTGPLIYKGSYNTPSNVLFSHEPGTCSVTSSTTAACKGIIEIFPADGELMNADAGTWHAGALAIAWNGQQTQANPDMSKVGVADKGGLGTTLIQRYSRLTVNAGPEPVKKGRTLTATGKLSRANWEDNKYHGYTHQPVKLQFRKKGTSTYSTVKTVYSDKYGNVKATTTAKYDGYWRFSFAGTTTTPAVNATGDYVDVR